MTLTSTPSPPVRGVMRLRACRWARALRAGTQRAAGARAREGRREAIRDSAGSGGCWGQARRRAAHASMDLATLPCLAFLAGPVQPVQ